MITESFIRELPKTDLHIHLDGSMRCETLIELAQQQNIELPSFTTDGLMELVFKNGYKDLPEYLQGFAYTCAVLQNPESLEQVAYELACDNIEEGVRYLEVRFAPMLHVRPGLDMETIMLAVNKGLDRAKSEHNSKLSSDSAEPEFNYGIIACAMRMFTPEFSSYYRKISEAHQYMPPRKLYGLASLELARAMVDIRDRTGVPITGFDLAGAEDGYPAEDHIEAYAYVHRHFMNKTVHAGEAYGAESIFQAISRLHADRIGHGYHLFDEEFICDPRIDKARFISDLSQFIAHSRLTIEVCLSSNKDTDPSLTSIADHPFRKMRDLKLSTTICTDNRLE